MGTPTSLGVEQRIVVPVLAVPYDLNANAYDPVTTDGFYYHGYHHRSRFCVLTGTLTGTDGVVTLQQATDADGTGAKALAFTVYYKTSAATDWVMAIVESGTLTLALDDTLYIVEVMEDDLDVNAGAFNFVAGAIAAATAAAGIQAWWEFFDSGLKSTPDAMKSPYSVA